MTNEIQLTQENGFATLNVTWARNNGDLPDLIQDDLPDLDVLRVAEEAIRSGYIPGIPADAAVNLSGFKVDRYDGRVFVRPGTPFGR